MIFAQFGTFFFFWLRMLSLAQFDQLLKKYQNSPPPIFKIALWGKFKFFVVCNWWLVDFNNQILISTTHILIELKKERVRELI